MGALDMGTGQGRIRDAKLGAILGAVRDSKSGMIPVTGGNWTLRLILRTTLETTLNTTLETPPDMILGTTLGMTLGMTLKAGPGRDQKARGGGVAGADD